MWRNILAAAHYPKRAVVLDWESFYSQEYSLKALSTVEYVCDTRFDLTGLGLQYVGERATEFVPPHIIENRVGQLKNEFGKDFELCTLVTQNSKYDCLVLRERFGITPRYTIDLIDLDRMWDARARHSLEAMAKRWKAPTLKGDTKQFKGLHWADMTPEQRKELGDYCKNDVEIESFLFQQLLPLTPNPQIELPLATQTLHLYLKPSISVDLECGEKLKAEMQQEMLNTIDTVEWVLDYAD